MFRRNDNSLKKLKVYLDTSIINFLEADDAPEYKKSTENFFENVVAPEKIEVYISNVVIDEINDTNNEKTKSKLHENIKKYPNIKMLATNDENIDEIAFLVENYITNGIIPNKKAADAFHIAYSTIFQMDVLLSWNFKHLANINKEQKILGLNKILGYNHPFRMANPLEVYFDE
jgi:rRNA-processing protein FCF1